MSRHDDLVRLHHMRDHANEAIQLAREKTYENLLADRLLQLALTRLVEIVGEAASKVSEATRAVVPEIPWAEAVGMRHRIVHGYDIVDWKILWETLSESLPPLIEQLDAIIPRLAANDS